jgi:LuxR family transcriptional regulator, maltose regulon positive regulatory protein
MMARETAAHEVKNFDPGDPSVNPPSTAGTLLRAHETEGGALAPARPAMVGETPFDLLEIKLAPPLIRHDTVAKTDVITRLCAASAPFATVVAPAGYGKTTLLVHWAEADARSFAWVALDGREDSALVLLRYIVAAIHRVEPLPTEVFALLSGKGGATSSTRVPRVGRALATVQQPFVLALDDLHVLANPACLDVLAELSKYIPAGSQIAVASRSKPALPLARWRTLGIVDEIGVLDLRLDDDEADALLEGAGIKLGTDELSELNRRTEGWPAGLYLAALAVQSGAPSPGHSDIILTGDDRFVSDYFRHEVLARLPPAEAKFLKYTSILDRMCGGLCDAVLEGAQSSHILEGLEGANYFVVPLDRHGEWYRYHHLFGELLRNELERSEPKLAAELNARAMAWCIANDMPEDALGYGHAAGDTDTVASLVERLALAVYRDGRRETLDSWLAWFSDDELARYPALAVVGAWCRVVSGRPEEAERWLALADGASSAIPLSDGSATIEPWVATLRAHMMMNGLDQALADANRALETFSPDSAMIPDALLSRGIAHALLDATDAATNDLKGTIELALEVGASEDVNVAHAQLALLAARQGAWTEAARQAHAAQALVEETGLGDYAGSALAHAAAARVAIHEARQEDARAALMQAHRLRPYLDHGLPWLTVQVGLELARAHLALTEPSAARTILAETDRVLELRPNLGFLVEDARELRKRAAAASGSDSTWAMSLTRAELRLLPYLATHLTFPEIAARLYISRNTAKTEAVSIYRKLGTSSRSQAIERAVEVGLLDASLYPPPANLIQKE